MHYPVILKEDEYDKESLAFFKKKQRTWKTVDIYLQQMHELFEISYPNKTTRQLTFEEYCRIKKCDELRGNWVYYPWSGILLHTLCSEDLFILRTNRNKNLITADEQKKLYDLTIAIIGLSVGNGIALTLTYSGISKTLKLADNDKLETANLNRVRASLKHVGLAKTEIAAQQIFEIDPFATPLLFEKGITDNNLEKLFGNPKPKIIFDEMDDFQMKIKLRIKARQKKVPVIMLTTLGDRILIDIERYDLNNNIQLFNGIIGNTPEEILKSNIGEREKIRYAIELVGAKYIPVKALQSLFEINNTLVGRPQLASTTTIDGGLGALLVRRIVLGHEVPSGRYFFDLEKAGGFRDLENKSLHRLAVKKLDRIINNA